MATKEKRQQSADSGNSSSDLARNAHTSPTDDQIAEKPTEKKRSVFDYFELPEWKVGRSHLQGRPLNYAIGLIASCGFLMFGYDQGVLSALLTLDTFQQSIPLMTPREKSNPICWLNAEATIANPKMCTGSANTQAAGVAIYQVGCFLGAVLIFFFGEGWGRRPSTWWGSLIIVIGTAMQAASFGYGLFIAGRVVGGIGNGMVTSSTYTSKTLRNSANSHSYPDMAVGMRPP